MWKFYGKTQSSFTWNSTKALLFYQNFTPGNWVKLWYFKQWRVWAFKSNSTLSQGISQIISHTYTKEKISKISLHPFEPSTLCSKKVNFTFIYLFSLNLICIRNIKCKTCKEWKDEIVRKRSVPSKIESLTKWKYIIRVKFNPFVPNAPFLYTL